MPSPARCASSSGSATALVPCPIRSACRSRSADQIVSGPVVSPACGTRCRPPSRAIVERVAVPVSRHADLVAAQAEADRPIRTVPQHPVRCRDAAGRSRASPRCRTPRPARRRAARGPACGPSVSASASSSGSMPIIRCATGVTVTSAYRTELRGEVGGEPVDQRGDVRARGHQPRDLDVDLDEVREVGELVERDERVPFGGDALVGVAPGQLEDGVDGRRADEVDVQLDLGESGEEIEHMTILPDRPLRNSSHDRVRLERLRRWRRQGSRPHRHPRRSPALRRRVVHNHPLIHRTDPATATTSPHRARWTS